MEENNSGHLSLTLKSGDHITIDEDIIVKVKTKHEKTIKVYVKADGHSVKRFNKKTKTEPTQWLLSCYEVVDRSIFIKNNFELVQYARELADEFDLVRDEEISIDCYDVEKKTKKIITFSLGPKLIRQDDK